MVAKMRRLGDDAGTPTVADSIDADLDVVLVAENTPAAVADSSEGSYSEYDAEEEEESDEE